MTQVCFRSIHLWLLNSSMVFFLFLRLTKKSKNLTDWLKRKSLWINYKPLSRYYCLQFWDIHLVLGFVFETMLLLVRHALRLVSWQNCIHPYKMITKIVINLIFSLLHIDSTFVSSLLPNLNAILHQLFISRKISRILICFCFYRLSLI